MDMELFQVDEVEIYKYAIENMAIHARLIQESYLTLDEPVVEGGIIGGFFKGIFKVISGFLKLIANIIKKIFGLLFGTKDSKLSTASDTVSEVDEALNSEGESSDKDSEDNSKSNVKTTLKNGDVVIKTRLLNPEQISCIQDFVQSVGNNRVFNVTNLGDWVIHEVPKDGDKNTTRVLTKFNSNKDSNKISGMELSSKEASNIFAGNLFKDIISKVDYATESGKKDVDSDVTDLINETNFKQALAKAIRPKEYECKLDMNLYKIYKEDISRFQKLKGSFSKLTGKIKTYSKNLDSLLKQLEKNANSSAHITASRDGKSIQNYDVDKANADMSSQQLDSNKTREVALAMQKITGILKDSIEVIGDLIDEQIKYLDDITKELSKMLKASVKVNS